jgi:pyruvate/2-oxoglutarate dehydrogenase complex dihydrolipoamide acyltransferase (E2) component
MPVPPSCTKLTRREALALGAAAGAAATLGAPGSALASAASGVIGEGSAPSFLRRSTYPDLVGEDFDVRGHLLRLVAVDDLEGARVDPSLRGHEGAFALHFDGPAGALAAEIHELSHPLFGPFPLFLGPSGAVEDGRQRYAVTVDRSVRIRLPEAPRPAAPTSAAQKPAAPVKADEPAPAPSPPTPQDLEIAEQRRVELHEAAATRRLRARRARSRLRQAHDRRIRFKRKQRSRMRRARTGWLKAHGR